MLNDGLNDLAIKDGEIVQLVCGVGDGLKELRRA